MEDKTISRKVFVGNLSYQTTEAELRDAFSAAGQVESARIITDRETGRSRGFAFVEYSSEEEAAQAARSMNDAELGGRKLRVNPAEDRPRSGPPGGGRDRGFQGNRGRGERSVGGEGGYGGGGGDFGKPFGKPKGSRRGIRGRKRSLG